MDTSQLTREQKLEQACKLTLLFHGNQWGDKEKQAWKAQQESCATASGRRWSREQALHSRAILGQTLAQSANQHGFWTATPIMAGVTKCTDHRKDFMPHVYPTKHEALAMIGTANVCIIYVKEVKD